MRKQPVLLIDAGINLVLGILLLDFSPGLIEYLGVPASEQRFYPNILGAIFIGIAIALVMEHYRKPEGMIGLGLGGAVVINLCGGITLFLWLIFGGLNLPLRGVIFLWGLALILVFISTVEWVMYQKEKG